MNHQDNDIANQELALWGGLECTVNRVHDQYFSQMDRNGHATRAADLGRFASLGIRAIRYPVLWERTAPDALEDADWTWADERLPELQALGVTPIVGLLHHGSGPRHTSLVSPDFPDKLAAYAGAVAARYPWVEYYTPVNEPLTTARFSGLYGVWYPHARDDAAFVQALVNQCRGTVLAMAAIRAVNPDARLVQTDDICKFYGTGPMAGLVEFYNQRRWLSWDLLCGKVDPQHALWDYLVGTGIDPAELLWFRDHPCPPDVIGVNYYTTSERWLDHRAGRYHEHYHHSYRGMDYADIETARVLATPTPGIGPLLRETWERYGLPVAVTEAHVDANREDQLRWLLEIWDAAQRERADGADIRAVTVWALLGSFDWNCLVTECRGYYEPGPFDVRGAAQGNAPRATALAAMMRELASKRPLSNPVLQGEGWWRRPGRLLAPPVSAPAAVADLTHVLRFGRGKLVQPILITGGAGMLGNAFARMCERRNLAFRVLGRGELDVTDPASVDAAIHRYRPWAIVNAAGFARVGQAEIESERCRRENTLGPTILGLACIRHGLRFVTYSSSLVFDGLAGRPYLESDATAAPEALGAYARSKVAAERHVLDADPYALVIRTSALFGPWDARNFVSRALSALARGQRFAARDDVTVTPTYLPDLVHASLDLLIDKEAGIWHLTNGTAVTWLELAAQAAQAAGLDAAPLAAAQRLEGRTPLVCALGSERGLLLPPLAGALARYAALRADPAHYIAARSNQ